MKEKEREDGDDEGEGIMNVIHSKLITIFDFA